MSDLKKIFRMIDQCEVVSFDIFDTLLVRNTVVPETIFRIVEKTCHRKDGTFFNGFAEKRVQAGKTAAYHAENNEATLAEIYLQLNSYTNEERQVLMEAELSCETKYLQPNPEILDIYRYCCEQHKRIIVISDMYLPSAFLKNLLSQKGFECEKLYVSCEEKANKHIGELFSKVSKELAVDGSRILHIGDNLRNDWLMPIKNGWKAYRIVSGEKPCSFSSVEDEVIEMLAHHNRPDDFFTCLGFTLLGPLLWRFSFWLAEQTGKDGNAHDTLLFLSRDGQIMLKAYQLLFGGRENNRCHYFHASRRALNTCMIWKHPSFNELQQYITVTRNFTLSVFLDRIGLTPTNYAARAEAAGLHLTDEFECSEFWGDKRIKTFYHAIQNDVIRNSKEQFELLMDFLLSIGVQGSVGIVDIGWRGSMQKRLAELFEDVPTVSLNDFHGYYMGIESEQTNMHGFLFEGEQSLNKTVIDAGFGLFETLFLAHEGTTLGYFRDHASIVPLLADYEIQDAKMKANLDQIHEGALQFICEMKRIGGMELHECDSKNPHILDGLMRLIMQPTKEEIKVLGEVPFNDTINSTLIAQKGFGYYLLHPDQIKKDYHAAVWKIGFLKENIWYAFPWDKIYWKLKRQ